MVNRGLRITEDFVQSRTDKWLIGYAGITVGIYFVVTADSVNRISIKEVR